MRLEQSINFRVTGRQLHTLQTRARAKQRLDRFGRAPVCPIGVNTRAHRECERRSASAVSRVDGRASLDQESHRVVARSPSGDVKRGTVWSHTKVAVALRIKGAHGYAQLEQR